MSTKILLPFNFDKLLVLDTSMGICSKAIDFIFISPSNLSNSINESSNKEI